MAALFLCYHSTALCTSKGNISASAICYLWRFIYLSIYCCVGRPSQASLATSVAFPVAFISVYSLCCNMLTANDSEVVDWGHEHTLLWPSIFLQVSSDHRCCGQGPPVLKLEIINQLKQVKRKRNRYGKPSVRLIEIQQLTENGVLGGGAANSSSRLFNIKRRNINYLLILVYLIFEACIKLKRIKIKKKIILMNELEARSYLTKLGVQ